MADIGCGPGASLPLIQANGFQAVVGLDTDEAALAFAGENARRLGIDFHPVPADLTQGTLNLPIGIAAAAMSMNVVIHTGFGPVLRAARQLLSAGGLLAVADRDYARLEVWDSPSVEALVALIRPLVMRGDRDYHRAEHVAEAHGFRAVAGDSGRWQVLEGANILDAFAFVGCMNDSASARALKQALAHVEGDPGLPSARLRVVDRWLIVKRIPGAVAGGDRG